MAGGFSGIGVDPGTLRAVAHQCQQVQGDLTSQVQSLQQQLSQLNESLQGPAAESFKTQFQRWESVVRQMSETLGATATTLSQIAQTADEQIAALRRLAGN